MAIKLQGWILTKGSDESQKGSKESEVPSSCRYTYNVRSMRLYKDYV